MSIVTNEESHYVRVLDMYVIVTSISRLLALFSAVSNFTIRAWRIK